MAQLNTTELDFDQIKQNLKDHFKRTGSAFQDWDFDGSGLSSLLDVLAYNTHYNAVNAHMAMNESFLDSAQLRSNVVSRAKLLGYTPRSRQSPIAYVTITVPRRSDASSESTFTLPEGTKFTTALNSVTYTFQTIGSITVGYDTEEQAFVFTNVPIYQGRYRKISYTINTAEYQKFVINDANIDTRTLRVLVRPSRNATVEQGETYTSFRDFNGISGTSPVYFINENGDGYYDIRFGDGVLGKAPSILSVVDIEFMTTDGPAANGARTFALASELDPTVVVNNEILVATTTNAQGGAEKETIPSIKHNAPLSFITQNRAVTAEDYKALISQNITGIRSISVWGGESNPIPRYGKVYISLRPEDINQETVDANKKNEVQAFLESKKIISIQPDLVDPDYTYLYFEVFFKYNSARTTLSKNQLVTQVRNTISQFNEDRLNNFDGVFRFSKFLQAIDISNSAIANSIARVYAYKKLPITVVNSVSQNSGIDFGFQIDGRIDQRPSMIGSSRWLIGSTFIQLADETIVGDTEKRNVYLFTRSSDGGIVKYANSVGYLYPRTGQLLLTNLPANEDVTIDVFLRPASDDMVAERNEIITIDLEKTIVVPDIDASSSGTSSLLSEYTTFARNA